MKRRPGQALINWTAVVIYCGAIFIQSSYPSMAHLHDVPFGDKYLHAAGYALLGILFFRAFRSSHGGNRLFAVTLLSISAATLYGISDEIHQYFVPYRSADIRDVLADTAGSCLGGLGCYMIVKNSDIVEKYSWIDKLRHFL